MRDILLFLLNSNGALASSGSYFLSLVIYMGYVVFAWFNDYDAPAAVKFYYALFGVLRLPIFILWVVDYYML